MEHRVEGSLVTSSQPDSVGGVKKHQHDVEKNGEKNEGPPKADPSASLAWMAGAFGLAAAIGLAIALGATSTRWSHNTEKVVPQACQFVGAKVDVLMPAIGATSNCNAKGVCYNWTADQMKAYLGTPAFVSLTPNYFSCIDGRHDNEIIATPAGDMGVFLTGAEIFITNSLTPSDYSYARISSLLHGFIEHFRTETDPFYYHTDTHAVEAVVSTLAQQGITGGSVDFEEMCSPEFVPPPNAKAALIAALSNMSLGVGCGHVKNMGLFPSTYGVRNADLVVNAVKAMWTYKWSDLRELIRVDALDHDHAEQAVLSITDIQGCDGFAPIITQRSLQADGSPFYTQQIFVNHEAAVKVSQWFAARPGNTLPALDFYAKFNDLATVQLLQSALRLAKNRPLFNATITGQLFTPPYKD